LPRLAIARREPVASEIARALLDYVFSGKIAPGSKLPSERQLAERFGTGRSVVREALKSLGLLGLVDFRPGDGTYLRGPDSDLLPRVIEWGLLLGEGRTLDLVEARQHIEIVVAGLAAERRDAEDLRAIAKQLRAMERSRKSDAFVQADVGFHLRVAEASKNIVLSNMLTSIQSLLNVWVRRVIEAAGDTRPSFREHVPIFEAIERRDAAGASAAMAEHMRGAAGRLKAALAARADGRDPGR
jgi:GntR family transcriptional repressor for pyruvate dehydrogenase complex